MCPQCGKEDIRQLPCSSCGFKLTDLIALTMGRKLREINNTEQKRISDAQTREV